MTRDLSFLEFKDDDSEHMRGLKAYWQMVMAMSQPERQMFLQEELVKTEETQLQWMIACNQRDDDTVRHFTSKARSLAAGYDIHKDDTAIELAETFAEAARSTRQNRYTIADIRKQRERIQWEKTKLKRLTTEQQQSSSHSLT